MSRFKGRVFVGLHWHYIGFIETKEGTIFAGLPSSSIEPLSIEDLEKRFQQSTGLLDKNGVEIFEGDIICCRATKEHPQKTILVRWDVNCFNVPRISWQWEVITRTY